jgi:hypothetical protein
MQSKRARELGMISCDEVTRGRENKFEDNSRTMKKSAEVLRIWQTYLLILLLRCDAKRKQAQPISDVKEIVKMKMPNL